MSVPQLCAHIVISIHEYNSPDLKWVDIPKNTHKLKLLWVENKFISPNWM